MSYAPHSAYGDSVSDENGQLESELQSRAGEVLRVHRELQGAAAVRDSDAALQRADRHFFSSRTALRGAFRRFRRSVLQAVGVGRATQVLLRHFHAFVAGKIFSSWAGVIRAKRFGAAQEQRRALLAAVNCFSRWKTYSALQSHFKARAGMRTGRLVATVMDRWRGLAAERRWAQWAETASTQLQSRRLQRRVFAAWRKGTVFLPWTGDWLRVPSQLAHRHHRRRLLDAWRAVAAQSAGEDAARTKEVGVLILRRAIASWRLSQLAVPAFRNTGRKRVLRALRTACEEHAAGVLLEAAARGHRCRWSARRALWRMYHASGARAKCRSAELQLLEAAEYRFSI